MTVRSTERSLEMASASFTTIFAALAVATTVLFLFYSSEWAENTTENPRVVVNQINREVAAEYSYQATVILCLYIITGMHALTAFRRFRL
jgi:hypothetical protein